MWTFHLLSNFGYFCVLKRKKLVLKYENIILMLVYIIADGFWQKRIPVEETKWVQPVPYKCHKIRVKSSHFHFFRFDLNGGFVSCELQYISCWITFLSSGKYRVNLNEFNCRNSFTTIKRKYFFSSNKAFDLLCWLCKVKSEQKMFFFWKNCNVQMQL